MHDLVVSPALSLPCRKPRGGGSFNGLLKVAFHQGHDRTALSAGDGGRVTRSVTHGAIRSLWSSLVFPLSHVFLFADLLGGLRVAIGKPVRLHRFAYRGVEIFFPFGVRDRLGDSVAKWRSSTQLLTILGQWRASTTHPLLLETSIKGSWPFESPRDPTDQLLRRTESERGCLRAPGRERSCDEVSGGLGNLV